MEEVRALLAACDGFSERTKLYLLLMLNCGMYQNDIAELRKDEVNWKARHAHPRPEQDAGTERAGGDLQALAGDLRPAEEAPGQEGRLALTTDEGKPLVRYWLEGGDAAATT